MTGRIERRGWRELQLGHLSAARQSTGARVKPGNWLQDQIEHDEDTCDEKNRGETRRGGQEEGTRVGKKGARSPTNRPRLRQQSQASPELQAR